MPEDASLRMPPLVEAEVGRDWGLDGCGGNDLFVGVVGVGGGQGWFGFNDDATCASGIFFGIFRGSFLLGAPDSV